MFPGSRGVLITIVDWVIGHANALISKQTALVCGLKTPPWQAGKMQSERKEARLTRPVSFAIGLAYPVSDPTFPSFVQFVWKGSDALAGTAIARFVAPGQAVPALAGLHSLG
jgi:hypothetical protein